MAQQTINIGSGVESGDGDPSRVAWGKAVANFTDLDIRVTTNLGAIQAEAQRALLAESRLAPLLSPTFTGLPMAPTPAAGDNSTKLATTNYVDRAVAAGGGSGGGGTAYAVTYVAQSLTSSQQSQARQNIAAVAAGDSFTLGNGSTAFTQAAGDNTSKIATDAFVTGAITSYASTVSGTYLTQNSAAATYAPLASPSFTGTPTAPTPALADNSTKLATTAYADRAAASAPAAPPPAPAFPSSSGTMSTTSGTDEFATGTITRTVPNAGAGWRSGVVKNANTTSGLVTLAVPSGATLDGVSNGTTILFPYQRARIIQTGSTAYVTDWIDRTPIIQITSIASGSAEANVQIVLPVGYGSFELTVKELQPSATGAVLQGRISFDGSTIATASNYNSYWIAGYGGTVGQNGNSAAGFFTLISGGISVSSGFTAPLGKMLIYAGGGSLSAASGNMFTYSSDWVYVDNQPYLRKDSGYGTYNVNSGRVAMLQLSFSTGNISGQFTVRAIP